MHSRRARFPYPFRTWRTFVLIPAVVVVMLAAAQSASAATSPTPIVTTGLAVNVESNAATVWGTVDDRGEAATYRFDYGTSTNYTSQTISEPVSDSNSSPTSVDARLTGLSPNTIYYYRIEATDAWGTSYGADQTVTTTGGTQSSPPAVATGSASGVEADSATVAGAVNPSGTATTYHFDYGTSTNYTSQAPAPPDPSAGSGTTAQTESISLTGLSPNTVYHYRIEAANASGTNYGADQTFTTTGGTQSSPPAVATGSASGVGVGSAIVAGAVNPNGTATTYHFDYGTSTNYTSQAPAPPDPSAGSGTTPQTESISLTGLSPNTLYHYRIEAANAWGTSYGADQTFTTGKGSSGTPYPLASFTATPVVIHNRCGFIGMFNASASLPAEGTSIAQYAWSFGDGSSAVTASPQAFHGYHAGTYHVVLTVTDADGTSASASRAIVGWSGSLYCR